VEARARWRGAAARVETAEVVATIRPDRWKRTTPAALYLLGYLQC